MGEAASGPPPVAASDASPTLQDKPQPEASEEPKIQPAPAEAMSAEPGAGRAPEPAEITAPPADVVLETYPLHPAAARLWAWSQALVIAIPLVPLMIAGGIWQGPKALLANALLGLLVWSIASRHLRLAVARFRCERFARGLRYRQGVWWQSEVFIPSARVQHTEVNQGPIARRYGIGKLKVFTAAVQLGALEIDGLAYTDAVLLRDRLLGRESEPVQDESRPDTGGATGDA